MYCLRENEAMTRLARKQGMAIDADWAEIDVAPEFVCLSFIAWGARRPQFDHDLAALELENNQ